MKLIATTKGAVGLICWLAALCFAMPVMAQDEAEQSPSEQEEGQSEDEAGQRPTPQLFVLPVDGVQNELSAIITERINDSVRQRLRSLSGVDFLPSFEEIHGGGQQTPASLLAEAEQDYTSGIGLVKAGHFQRAMEALQPAVATMEEHLVELRDFGLLSDALANLSIAYFEAGYDLDARRTIQRFAQIAPDATLDPDDYPDELIELFNAELERIEAAGTGIVTIESDRPGAQVYVNGELLGETPLTTEDIGFGEHYMVLRQEAWQWDGTIRVRARGQEQTESVELAHRDDESDEFSGMPSYYVDLRETIRSGRFGQELEPYLQEMANQTDADYIAWALAQQKGRDYAVTPFVYRVEDSLLIEGNEVLFNQQLSNMRSRSNELSDVLASAVVYMPEERAVEFVDLVGEEEVQEPSALAEGEDDAAEDEAAASQNADDGDATEDEAVAEADAEQESSQDPLPVPGPGDSGGAATPPSVDDDDADDGKMWRYIGWGGAAAVGVGAVVTTIVLITRGSGDGVGFEAEVQW